MSVWLIIPRDPLIFGDGKSFTSTPGEHSQSMPFPFPSTIAGAVRTLAGTNSATGIFDKELISKVKQISVRGPVLVEMNETENSQTWLFPAPADALIVDGGNGDNKVFTRYSLAPGRTPTGSLTNLKELDLVVPITRLKNKVAQNLPRFWRWEKLAVWLEDPKDAPIDVSTLGIQGPEREFRTHVNIDPKTQSAAEGMLFQTSGMEFSRVQRDGMKSMQIFTLALAVETTADIRTGYGHIGGERRVALWQKIQSGMPKCPPAIKKKISEQKHCRLMLATPASFDKGYIPSYLQSGFGITVTVRAAASSRYQTISGWDYENKKPKPTRRLAAAGSVYFLQLEGSQTEIEKFVDALWLTSISDDEQSRRDGFGLALLGVWDGELREVKA